MCCVQMRRSVEKRSRKRGKQAESARKGSRSTNDYAAESSQYFLRRSVSEAHKDSQFTQDFKQFSTGVQPSAGAQGWRGAARFRQRSEHNPTPQKVLLQREGKADATVSATPVQPSPQHPGHVRTAKQGRLWRRGEVIAEVEGAIGKAVMFSLTPAHEKAAEKCADEDLTGIAKALQFVESLPVTERSITAAELTVGDFQARATHKQRSVSQRALHGHVSASDTLNREIEQLLSKYDQLEHDIGSDAVSVFKYSRDMTVGSSAEYAHTRGRCVYPTSPSRLLGGPSQHKVETIPGLGTILDPQFKENCPPASRHHNTKQLLGERLVQFSHQLRQTLKADIGRIICRTGSARIGDSLIHKAFIELENPDLGIKIRIPCNQPLTQKQPHEVWFNCLKDFYMSLIELATTKSYQPLAEQDSTPSPRR